MVGVKITHYEVYSGLDYQSGWLSFYEFFERLDIVKHPEFSIYKQVFKAGVWSAILFRGVAILSKLPVKTNKDQRGRLHSLTEPAILFIDGFTVYAIHGVRFSQELWEKVTKKQLSAKEILSLENAEQRYTALTIYGADKLLMELGANLIEKSRRGNELYALSCIIPTRTLKLLKYSDPSTGRIYVCFVPDTIETPDAGMSWKFQITDEEYKYLNVEA